MKNRVGVVVLLGALLGWPMAVLAAGDGAALYADCAACHGKDGGGVADAAVPAIAGQPATLIEKQLNAFRSAQRRDLRMQHFADAEHLTDAAAVRAVAAYVASLTRSTPAGVGPGENLAAAERRFAASCAGCHGLKAGPNALTGVPGLAGQHYGYLRGKIEQAAAGRSHLAASHARLLQRSSPSERDALADYLARQAPVIN